MDLLTKLAYDSDEHIAMSSIFALGLTGAGTNNSKLAQNLRLLASYYSGSNDTADRLFVVRIAQGLVHLGKVSENFGKALLMTVLNHDLFLLRAFLDSTHCIQRSSSSQTSR